METGLIGGIEQRPITIVEYDSGWPQKFTRHARILADALGAAALRIEHVGSTSVPGLAAKPIVDILMVVADSGDESLYFPALWEPAMSSACVSPSGTNIGCFALWRKTCTSMSTRLVVRKSNVF